MDSRIWCNIQLEHMTPTPCTNSLYAKPCKNAEIYNEITFNDIFIGDVDSSILRSLRKYWDTHPQADVTEIAF